MQGGLATYKLLRIYSSLPLTRLINLLFCNRLVNCKTLLRNSASLYQMGKYVPGKIITNWMINKTIGQAFTIGDTVPQMQKNVLFLYSRGISPIVQYLPAVQSEGSLPQHVLQTNAALYRRSSDAAALRPNNYFSIKISALINIDLLHKYNRAIQARDRLWKDSCHNGQFSSQKMFDNLQQIYRGLTEDDYSQYLLAVHGFTGKAAEFTIDETSFRFNHCPFFLYEDHKNESLVSKILLPLDQEEKTQMLQFKSRLQRILNGNYDHQNQPKVMWQAQQSAIQQAIDNFFMQSQKKYNKQRVYIINTLQNYLQNSQSRLKMQMLLAEKQGLYFGMNLVTGGYQLHEREGITNDPLDNLLRNFKQISISSLRGEILISDHNEKHINAILKARNRYPSIMQVSYAQFYNIGDHLTSQLKVKRQSVYKMLPWGQPQTVIPYLLYRSKDIGIFDLPFSTQYSLLKHELLIRIFGP